MSRRRILTAVLVGLLAAVSAVGASASAPASGTAGWTSTQNAAVAYAPTGGGFGNQTLRMAVRTSLGGSQIRIHLTNRYSATATQIGHVTVGMQGNGADTIGTPDTVTFSGSQTVTMAAGASAVSDAVALPVAANTRLLISIFIPAGANATPPRHDLAGETEYNYVGGDESGVQVFPVTNTFSFVAGLDGVDVSATGAYTVVAMGDSVSDGLQLATDTDGRWPNVLADRVAPMGLAVTDQGISGDDVTSDQSAAPGIQTRWAVDALGQPGVRTVIEQGGINDIRTGVPVTVLEAAQQSLISSAHAAGVRVLLCTLTPMAGSSGDNSTEESALAAYNAWVLSGSSGADGVVDFNAALTNGAGALAAAYDSGDHLHPNLAGTAALADAVGTGQL